MSLKNGGNLDSEAAVCRGKMTGSLQRHCGAQGSGKLEEADGVFLLQVHREHCPADTWILDFFPTGLGDKVWC